MSFEDLPDHGDLIELDEFKDAVNCGAFIDYDGFGELATREKTSKIHIRPSDVDDFKFPGWCTHVLWFNR